MILKSLYGAKQSGRCWYQLLRDKLLYLGFTQSRHDPCLFYRWLQGYLLIVMLWVDDLIIICASMDPINALQRGLELEQRDSRSGRVYPPFEFGAWQNPIDELLGIGIHYDQDNRVLTWKHTFYLENIFEVHGLTGLRVKSHPKPTDDDLKAKPTEIDYYILNNYSELLGKLMYSMLTVLIGIAYDVGFCARMMAQPTLESAVYLKCLLRFVKGQAKTGLTFLAGEFPDLVLHWACCDSSFADDADDRARATHSNSTFISLNCIRNKSRKPKYTGKTTNETELLAAPDSTDYVMGDRWILMELGFQLDKNPCRMFMDNNATLTQVSLVRFNLGRTRHLRATFWNTMDAKEAGDLEPRRIDTNENISDIGTKHLGPAKFKLFFDSIQGTAAEAHCSIKVKIIRLLRARVCGETKPVPPRGGAAA